MTANQLSIIQNTFVDCFSDSAVFDRREAEGNYFEADDIRKDNSHWLVIAAGLTDTEARSLFKGNTTRAKRASIPLRFMEKCEISVLFVARPFLGNAMDASSRCFIAPFAPKRGMPWIELRQARVRISSLPPNRNSLQNFRWEYDCRQAKQQPLEGWLHRWNREFGFNPAHSPSHLHINSDELSPDETRPGDTIEDLRLAIGNPNPLVLIMSIAVWLRRILIV